eukprot:Rmarinus@m.840
MRFSSQGDLDGNGNGRFIGGSDRVGGFTLRGAHMDDYPSDSRSVPREMQASKSSSPSVSRPQSARKQGDSRSSAPDVDVSIKESVSRGTSRRKRGKGNKGDHDRKSCASSNASGTDSGSPGPAVVDGSPFAQNKSQGFDQKETISGRDRGIPKPDSACDSATAVESSPTQKQPDNSSDKKVHRSRRDRRIPKPDLPGDSSVVSSPSCDETNNRPQRGTMADSLNAKKDKPVSDDGRLGTPGDDIDCRENSRQTADTKLTPKRVDAPDLNRDGQSSVSRKWTPSWSDSDIFSGNLRPNEPTSRKKVDPTILKTIPKAPTKKENAQVQPSAGVCEGDWFNDFDSFGPAPKSTSRKPASPKAASTPQQRRFRGRGLVKCHTEEDLAQADDLTAGITGRVRSSLKLADDSHQRDHADQRTAYCEDADEKIKRVVDKLHMYVPNSQMTASVLEVYDFPPDVETADIEEIFTLFTSSGLKLVWKDDTCCFVVFPDTKSAEKALDYTTRLGSSRFRIRSLAKSPFLTNLRFSNQRRRQTNMDSAKRMLGSALGCRPQLGGTVTETRRDDDLRASTRSARTGRAGVSHATFHR